MAIECHSVNHVCGSQCGEVAILLPSYLLAQERLGKQNSTCDSLGSQNGSMKNALYSEI